MSPLIERHLTELFINNNYIKPQSTTRLSVTNPATGELVSDHVPVAGREDVDAAVKAGQEAFKPGSPWRSMTGQERQAILLKFADILEANEPYLASLTRLTLGAPRLPFGKALATGNVFILKPSEKTPFAAAALGKLVLEAGFPPGVFQVLGGDGSTGALLASHMNVAKVSFTGSVPTGKAVQSLAASSNLKRVTLELGGKSPAVVFDDANIQNAVEWHVIPF
ncbi:hypothetical protein D7B24_003225 [Verticillium nonalfalfae]|uniref:aldehyde dehydrogenase (NAD(+)) n=1 Tax=Verticillium nonalfalfae TaxID=1051616 RepID=A0A3M9YGT3_9PEZI|nr:uncharacterized protein D7B24_003225 [Verticillium nonalfalfae]RNJ59132.1 hypothetical protein D7B24_003225 [Verticillium nonalfalfae]